MRSVCSVLAGLLVVLVGLGASARAGVEGCEGHTFHLDNDGDGWGDPESAIVACEAPPGFSPLGGDCDDSNPAIWNRPGEVTRVVFKSDKVTLTWTEPAERGGLVGTLTYDTIRSAVPSTFEVNALCVKSGGSNAHAPDFYVARPGDLFYYLIRAKNACGGGSLGNATNGHRSQALECPRSRSGRFSR